MRVCLFEQCAQRDGLFFGCDYRAAHKILQVRIVVQQVLKTGHIRVDKLLIAFGQFVHEIEQSCSIPASNSADDAFMCRQKKNPVIGCGFWLKSRPQDDKKSDENTRDPAFSG